jgi:hypothetical protein
MLPEAARHQVDTNHETKKGQWTVEGMDGAREGFWFSLKIDREGCGNQEAHAPNSQEHQADLMNFWAP